MARGLSTPVVLLPLEWLLRRLRTSPRAQAAAIVLLGALVSLVLWQINVAWRNVGYGLAFAVPGAALLLAAARLHPRFMAHRWSKWVGLILLGFLAWGILAFFDGSGPLMESSLGGHFGDRIIGDRDALGALRLAGIAIMAVAILGPRPTWRLTRQWAPVIGRALLRADLTVCRAAWHLGRVPGQWALAAGMRAFHGTQRALNNRRRRLASPAPQRLNEEPAELWEDHEIAKEALSVAVAPQPAWEPPPEMFGDKELVDEPSFPPLEVEPAGAVRGPETIVPPPEPPDAEAFVRGGASQDGWRLPSLDILDHAPTGMPTQEDNGGRARAIEEALASYGIQASVVEINPGPAVTQFGVEPGWVRKYREVRLRGESGKPVLDEEGNPMVKRAEVARTRVKVDAIANLDKDLAMALAAPSIRIEAPVPGKSLVGIEVPNHYSETVTLRPSLESPTFQRLKAKSKLALVLGKGSGGETEVADLAKMPHLLVAGATGSGKSICLRSILVSLLMHATPRDLRLLLIDPKRVELVAFNSVPHLLRPVIQDTEKVIEVLRWAIHEMEERYKRFSAVGARNLEGYNNHRLVAEPLPFLVIVVDELADLMMAAPYDVEHTLTRLAQLGRATGIHLVVATQRPSVDVVTGLIKANFPTRMSFAVSSFVDSRTILDTGGAEKLLGKGDMLYLPQDAPKPKRIQGVFVSDAEVERLVHAWNSQRAAAGPGHLPTQPVETPNEPNEAAGPSEALAQFAATFQQSPETPGRVRSSTRVTRSPKKADAKQKADEDPLMPGARELAEQYRKLSPSLLQRRLKIGYTKAERLLDLLKEEGYGDSEEDGGS